MRDYDDQFRPHVVLRRIIIVVAVLTAVPVALWTVTGLVRSYVEPPKTPDFRQLAANAAEQQEGTGIARTASAWSVWQSATTFVSAHVGAPQIPSIRQLAATITGNANARSEANDRSSPAAEQSMPRSTSPMTVEARATVTDARDLSASPKDLRANDPNMPAAATKLTDASQTSMSAKFTDAAVTLPAGTRAGDFTTASVSTSLPPPDPGASSAWPSPARQNATSSTAAPWPAAPQIAATQQEAAQQNATEQPATAPEPPGEALPAGQPLAGRIPLPRRRPSDLAMVQITAANVPMPRPRPDITASATSPEATT